MNHLIGVEIAKLLADGKPRSAREVAYAVNVCKRRAMSTLISGEKLGLFVSEIQQERLVWKNARCETKKAE